MGSGFTSALDSSLNKFFDKFKDPAYALQELEEK